MGEVEKTARKLKKAKEEDVFKPGSDSKNSSLPASSSINPTYQAESFDVLPVPVKVTNAGESASSSGIGVSIKSDHQPKTSDSVIQTEDVFVGSPDAGSVLASTTKDTSEKKSVPEYSRPIAGLWKAAYNKLLSDPESCEKMEKFRLAALEKLRQAVEKPPLQAYDEDEIKNMSVPTLMMLVIARKTAEINENTWKEMFTGHDLAVKDLIKPGGWSGHACKRLCCHCP